MKYLSIGEAAILLGVAVSTLRLAPCFRTAGGHRRYALYAI